MNQCQVQSNPLQEVHLSRYWHILVSIHANAFGNGREWTSPSGWSVYTSRGQTRTDFSDGDADIEENFYILRHTICPAVLTENLFMTNLSD